MPGFEAVFELSSLDGTNGFQIDATSTAGVFRTSVSAGDVNGDGFDDLIIGAYKAGDYGNYSGASYVVFGQAGGFAAEIDLSSLNGTNGFQISGEAPDDRQRLFRRLGGGRERRRLRRPDRRRTTMPIRTEPCSGASYVVFGQAGALPPKSICLPWTGPTASRSAARRPTTRAACPSPRRGT